MNRLRGALFHLWPRRPPGVCSAPVPGPGRALHLGPVFWAGHNKWSKVKHVKGPKDEARGQMFMKLGLMIRLAVKEGGSNPEFNAALANILEQCRSKNMPKASIETSIRSAERSRAGSQQTFEARGPGGCRLLIQVLTENNTRSHQELKHLLNKNGGALSDGARHSFHRKGVVLAAAGGVSSERALELAIEGGAEDVQETEDEDSRKLLQFVCDAAALQEVRAALESRGVEVLSAGLEFLAHTLTLLDQKQLQAASTLIHALHESADVVQVWDNIQAPG